MQGHVESMTSPVLDKLGLAKDTEILPAVRTGRMKIELDPRSWTVR